MDMLKEFMGPRDPKMASYAFMESLKPTLIFTTLYLIFVLYLGPLMMKNRKPFILRTPLLIYNLSMVSANYWLLANLIKYGWSKYNWRCEPLDFSYNEAAVGIARTCWWIYISKLIEYCDTIFFVLRKKENQINFLHVFHHATVPIAAWFGVNYGPSGYSMIFPTINVFVHIWMYLYYGLSALGPRVQKYLWWKKYLTSLQLIQFLFVIMYYLQLYLFPKEGCEVSPFLFSLSIGQAVLYLVLFANFYLNLYSKSARKLDNDIVYKEEIRSDGLKTSVQKKIK